MINWIRIKKEQGINGEYFLFNNKFVNFKSNKLFIKLPNNNIEKAKIKYHNFHDDATGFDYQFIYLAIDAFGSEALIEFTNILFNEEDLEFIEEDEYNE